MVVQPRQSVFTARCELHLYTSEEFRLTFVLRGITGAWKLVHCK